jgi:hypothetical protein
LIYVDYDSYDSNSFIKIEYETLTRNHIEIIFCKKDSFRDLNKIYISKYKLRNLQGKVSLKEEWEKNEYLYNLTVPMTWISLIFDIYRRFYG